MTIDNLINWLEEAEDNNTWLVSTQSVKRHLEKIKETEQLTLTDVGSMYCDKCEDTGVIWSEDRLSAKTCGCK